MRLIGNTAAEVRRYLYGFPAPAEKAYVDHLLMPSDERLASPLEKSLFGICCRHCGALWELCAAPTGLPASYPHPERIQDAIR